MGGRVREGGKNLLGPDRVLPALPHCIGERKIGLVAIPHQNFQARSEGHRRIHLHPRRRFRLVKIRMRLPRRSRPGSRLDILAGIREFEKLGTNG